MSIPTNKNTDGTSENARFSTRTIRVARKRYGVLQFTPYHKEIRKGWLLLVALYALAIVAYRHDVAGIFT